MGKQWYIVKYGDKYRVAIVDENLVASFVIQKRGTCELFALKDVIQLDKDEVEAMEKTTEEEVRKIVILNYMTNGGEAVVL